MRRRWERFEYLARLAHGLSASLTMAICASE